MAGEGSHPKSNGRESGRSFRAEWPRAFVALGFILVACLIEGQAQTPIRIGQTIEGALEEGDRKMADGSYYDLYVFRGNRGQRIVVHLRSKDFQPYLTLLDENGVEILSDSGEHGHAHIRCTLAHSGRYFIRINSVRREGKGRYQLQLLEQ